MQTEQEWATKLRKLEADRDRALAAKDILLQQAMQKAQAEAQGALQRLRSDSTAEAKRMSTKYESEMSTLKARLPIAPLIYMHKTVSLWQCGCFVHACTPHAIA